MDLRPQWYTVHADPTLQPDHPRRQNSLKFPVNISLHSRATANGLLRNAGDGDVSGRVQTEKKFQTLLESASHAMVIVDQTATIVGVNSQTEELFGFSRADLLGKTIELLIPERYRGRQVQQRDGFFRQPRLRPLHSRLQLYGLRRDGTEFPAEIGLNPWQTEKGIYVSAAIHEISDKQATADRFRKDNGALEARNSGLAARNAKLDGFSYSVSQELRPVLHQIERCAQLLLEQPSSVTPAQRECLEQIQLATGEMAQWLARIVTYARLNGYSLDREGVDLRQLVKDVISRLELETHQRKVS